jgi:hypothetical protein
MMTLWQTPAVVLTLVTWLTSPPANLAEIAQREALRKSMTPKSAGSYSNDNLRPDMFPVRLAEPVAAAAAEGSIASAQSAPQTTAGATQPGEATPQPVALKSPAMDEKAWRNRMAEARANLDRDQGLVEAMQSRVNSLQNDVINRDDPAQQAALRQTLAKSIGELERLKAQVAADQKAISDIQTEARKQNVPPGWVR